jgi:hypothetical protein
MAPSSEDDRRPWSMPPATQPPGDAHESSVPGPTLGGDSSTRRGCTGRAGCRSRSRRRFGPCQSYAPAAPTSGRACPPSAPSCVERPLGRTSQTPIPATSAPRRGDGPVGRRGCDPPWCGDRTRRSTGLPRMVGQPWVGMMRPRPWSAFATWLTRPLRRFVASLRKLAKQRGAKQARKHADRARERAALAKRRELAAHARAINLQEQAAALQERLGHPDPGRQSACPCRACAGAPGPGA